MVTHVHGCEGCGAPQGYGHPAEPARNTCEYCGRLTARAQWLGEAQRPMTLQELANMQGVGAGLRTQRDPILSFLDPLGLDL